MTLSVGLDLEAYEPGRRGSRRARRHPPAGGLISMSVTVLSAADAGEQRMVVGRRSAGAADQHPGGWRRQRRRLGHRRAATAVEGQHLSLRCVGASSRTMSGAARRSRRAPPRPSVEADPPGVFATPISTAWSEIAIGEVFGVPVAHSAGVEHRFALVGAETARYRRSRGRQPRSSAHGPGERPAGDHRASASAFLRLTSSRISSRPSSAFDPRPSTGRGRGRGCGSATARPPSACWPIQATPRSRSPIPMATYVGPELSRSPSMQGDHQACRPRRSRASWLQDRHAANAGAASALGGERPEFPCSRLHHLERRRTNEQRPL